MEPRRRTRTSPSSWAPSPGTLLLDWPKLLPGQSVAWSWTSTDSPLEQVSRVVVDFTRPYSRFSQRQRFFHISCRLRVAQSVVHNNNNNNSRITILRLVGKFRSGTGSHAASQVFVVGGLVAMDTLGVFLHLPRPPTPLLRAPLLVHGVRQAEFCGGSQGVPQQQRLWTVVGLFPRRRRRFWCQRRRTE
jgi:hypothetical protein